MHLYRELKPSEYYYIFGLALINTEISIKKNTEILILNSNSSGIRMENGSVIYYFLRTYYSRIPHQESHMKKGGQVSI